MAIEPGPQFEGVSDGDNLARIPPSDIIKTHNLGDMYDSSTGELKSKKSPEEWLDMSFKAASKRPQGPGLWSPNPGFDGGLAQSMKAGGFRDDQPIVVHVDHPSGKPTVIEGHHRLAVASKLFPDQPIPVLQLTSEEVSERRKAQTSKRATYNTTRAYKKAERLAEVTHERQIRNAAPNGFAGKCAGCGERVEAGEGKMIRTVFPGPKGGKSEVYHNDHLPEQAR